MIRLYQLYYDDNSEKHVDKENCIPFKNDHDHHLREWMVMRRIYFQEESSHWGCISWKFQQKCGITPKEAKGIIEQYLGKYDVIAFNPFKFIESQGLWNQAAQCHGLELIDAINKASEILNLPKADLGNDIHSDLIFCNYIYGTREFWTEYFEDYFMPYHYALQGLSSLGKIPGLHDHHNCRLSGIRKDHGFYPYITERLISKYLNENPGVSRIIL